MDRKVVGAYILGEEFSQTTLGRIVKVLPVEGKVRINLFHLVAPEVSSMPEAGRLIEHHAGLWSKVSDLHTLALTDYQKTKDGTYIVTEYLQGRLLSDVIRRCREEGIPFAPDQAVYMAERMAGALVSLSQQRVLCGGLNPDRILITFEGEVKILPCVFRDLQSTPLAAEKGMESLWRYLPPDQAAGKVSNQATDIYSIGALFFEFLCGQPFRPSMEVFDPVARLDAAAKGLDASEPPPEDLFAIIKKSLLPGSDGAYTSLAGLKEDLDRLITSGEYSPTTFNVAFLMHSLFRGEDEAEDEADKAFVAVDRSAFHTAPRPERASPPPAEPQGQSDVTRQEPSPAPEASAAPPATEEVPRSRKGLFIGIAAAVLIVIVGLVAWFSMPHGPEGPSPEELQAQAQLKKIAEERAQFEASQKAMAARLQALEDQKKNLEDQVSKARTNAEKTRARKALEDAQRKLEAQQNEQKKLEKAPPAAPPPRSEPAKEEAGNSAPKPTPPSTAPAGNEPAAPSDTAAPSPASSAAPPNSTESKKTATKPGDEVPLWAVDIRPKAVNKFRLTVTDLARRNRLRGTIYVEVSIDETGSVTDAKIVKGISPDYGMNNAVRRAALKLRYTPALKDGVPVKTTLTFPVVVK
jgi:TonB family protein